MRVFSFKFDKRWWLGILLISMLFIANIFFEALPAPNFCASPDWHGITPEQTTIDQAYHLLGQPDRVEYYEGYIQHIYQKRPDLEWSLVELWERNNGNGLVEGIWMTGKFYGDNQRFLRDYVFDYGRPDSVLWSAQPNYRFLLWAHCGIAITASAWTQEFDWDENFSGEIFYFKPRKTWDFLLNDRWPWTHGGGWGFWNMNGEGAIQNPDRFPRDPYDWENMPTLLPTFVPESGG